MQIRRIGAGLAAVALIVSLAACGKDQQEAAKFERADNENFVRDMSDVTSFSLDNGIIVYVQEEHTAAQVAVEVLYRAGFLDEPKGKAQLSHVTEHLAIHCGSGSFGPDESLHQIQEGRGMINAEAVSDFSHVDYIVNSNRLDEVLAIEAQRLTSLSCDEATRKAEVEKCIKEIDSIVASPTGSLAKYGMMALNQALYRGERFVPVRDGADRITIADVNEFHRAYYRPDDAIIVIIGDIKAADAEALVRKHFEGLPRRSQPSQALKAAPGNIQATWDIDGQALYLVSPGPYASQHERLILTMFGSYLHQLLMTSQDIYGICRSVYASNQIYRVDDIPFFAFAEPQQGRTIDEIRPLLTQYVLGAVDNLDDARVDAIKGGMVAFITATSLKKDVPDYPLTHYQVIGQEALNIGMKHALREGRPVDAFIADVNAVTPAEFRAVVAKYVNSSRLQEVAFTQKR
ncbi:MAG TPA: pitrilysin family protein [Candidatus Krumholzibacteria bacterium]|nr:pitrilysin family protein [Candidatus Krumholzibacteria bacterium]